MYVKIGDGEFKSHYGDSIRGVFLRNKPHGECELLFADGSSYSGAMSEGKKHGIGTL